VVALIQNPNVSAKILHAPFTINIYNSDSAVPLKTITSDTYVPKNSSFGIFEGPFNSSAGIPTRATFSWDNSSLVWQKDTSDVPVLKITDGVLSNTSTKPRLEATITNPTPQQVTNIELVTFIYDTNGNTVGASKTFVDTLNPNESAPIIFTWPGPFQGDSATFDIIPRILPNKSYLQ
jgi:hypothetical protein